MQAQEHSTPPAELSFERPDSSTLVVRVAGDWHLRSGMPSPRQVVRQLDTTPKPKKVAFQSGDLKGWDSGLLTFLMGVGDLCHQRKLELNFDGLPDGVEKLIKLAETVPEKTGARHEREHSTFIETLGQSTISFATALDEFLSFLGLVVISFGKLLVGKARFRRVDLMVIIQDCGANAFGIVTLISFLVGTILAFMGSVQLQQFGATIFVADLVGIAMARDMGGIMTAIIMAGRTGAAFAAQIGSMKVTQEVDALTTMGISPLEFLVLPRVIALVLMIPLLCLYADCMGILGGAFRRRDDAAHLVRHLLPRNDARCRFDRYLWRRIQMHCVWNHRRGRRMPAGFSMRQQFFGSRRCCHDRKSSPVSCI